MTSFTERMSADEQSALVKKIKESKDIKWLATILASDQLDYWYDPCGKSGFDVSKVLTNTAARCIERIARLTGVDGRGGID